MILLFVLACAGSGPTPAPDPDASATRTDGEPCDAEAGREPVEGAFTLTLDGEAIGPWRVVRTSWRDPDGVWHAEVSGCVHNDAKQESAVLRLVFTRPDPFTPPMAFPFIDPEPVRPGVYGSFQRTIGNDVDDVAIDDDSVGSATVYAFEAPGAITTTVTVGGTPTPTIEAGDPVDLEIDLDVP